MSDSDSKRTVVPAVVVTAVVFANTDAESLAKEEAPTVTATENTGSVVGTSAFTELKKSHYRERGQKERKQAYLLAVARNALLDSPVPLGLIEAAADTAAHHDANGRAATALVGALTSAGVRAPGRSAAVLVATAKNVRRIEAELDTLSEEATVAAIIEDKPREIRPLESLLKDIRATTFWMTDVRGDVKSSAQMKAIEDAQRAIASGKPVTAIQEQYTKTTGYFVYSATAGCIVKLAQRPRGIEVTPIEWYYQYYYAPSTHAVAVHLFGQVNGQGTVAALPTDGIDKSAVAVAF